MRARRRRLPDQAHQLRRAPPSSSSVPSSAGACAARPAAARAPARPCTHPGNIIGSSPAMQPVFDTVLQVAPTRATVLITGESGTGKELVARALRHAQSRAQRAVRQAPLRARSPRRCSRASCSVTRRARSPARSAARIGRFEQADGGTLFLDEIGEISPPDPGQAAARSCRSTSSSASAATRRIEVDVRVDRRDQPQPARAVSPGRPFPRGPLLPAQRRARSRCRRCARRGTDIGLLAMHFLRPLRAGERQADIEASPTRPSSA